jgi:glycine cleavage system transcriptional repressor
LTRHLALTAVGRDRPGIVAGVVEPLTRHGGNLEDSRMAILGGHFAMVLIVSGPSELDEAGLRSELELLAGTLGLDHLSLSPMADVGSATVQQTPTHLVTAYGSDHPGIVLAITQPLARLSVNVCDLQTRLVGDPPLYAMLVEIALPAGLEPATLRQELERAAGGARVELTLRELDHDAL